MYALHYTCSTRNLPETRHALAFHQSSGSSASGKNDQRRLGNWREPTAVNGKCWLLFRFMAALGQILFLILNNRLGRRRLITKGETLYRVGSGEKRPIILGPALLQINFFQHLVGSREEPRLDKRPQIGHLTPFVHDVLLLPLR